MPRTKFAGNALLANVLLLLITLLLLLITSEIIVRIALFKPVWINRVTKSTRLTEAIRNTAFYWSPFDICDRGFRLAAYFDIRHDIGRREVGFDSFDPDLGWVAGTNDPANVIHPYKVDSLPGLPRIIFLGNSFVFGLTEPEYSIPARLDRLLPGCCVLNLGVCGYGLDQCLVRMRKVVEQVDVSQVLIGIFYDDLNRCLFQMRGAPKPYYTCRGDSLVLHPIAPENDPTVWIETYKPSTLRSYALDFFKGIFRRSLRTEFVLHTFGPAWFYAQSFDHEYAESLIRLLLLEADKISTAAGIDLTFVLFPFPHDVEPGCASWHHQMLLHHLSDMQADYIDCSGSYREYLARNPDRKVRDLLPLNNHPNAELNGLIAQQIAEHLSERMSDNVREESP